MLQSPFQSLPITVLVPLVHAGLDVVLIGWVVVLRRTNRSLGDEIRCRADRDAQYRSGHSR